MLTSEERNGLKNILIGLSTEDIFSIIDTITRRMIIVESRKEAINAILSLTTRPSDLLRRQKITKKALFSYALNAKIKICPEASKADLIKACLTAWLSNETYQDSDYNQSEPEFVTSKDEQQFTSKDEQQFTSKDEQQFTSKDVQQRTDIEENTYKTMGEEFSKWFFNLLNSLQEFGPQHFWPDCKLWIECMLANNEIKTLGYSSSYDVVAFFNNLIAVEKYYFDANSSSEAVRCTQEHHGLVKIEISGVVHQHNNCVGLFDIRFGLVRNPLQDNNWKIKVIQLKINVRETMSITNSAYCHALKSTA